MNATPGEPGGRDPASTLLGAASDAWQAVRARFGSAVDLAAAEAELAARAGIGIVILAVLAVVALLTGWGFLLAALAGVVISLGVPWAGVALGFALLHFVLAALLLRQAAGLSRDLTLPALRRALRGDGP